MPEQIQGDCVVVSSERKQYSIGSREYERQLVNFRLREELLAEVQEFLAAFYDTLLAIEAPPQ